MIATLNFQLYHLLKYPMNFPRVSQFSRDHVLYYLPEMAKLARVMSLVKGINNFRVAFRDISLQNCACSFEDCTVRIAEKPFSIILVIFMFTMK